MPSYSRFTPAAPRAPNARVPWLPGASGGGPQYPDPFELAKLIPNINASMPGIQNVASGVNRFQQDETLGQVERLFPTLQPSLHQAGQNIESMLEGIVPLDVQHQLQSNTAARSLAQGVPGSPFAGNEFAESLGLTSLDLQGRGLNELLGVTSGVRRDLTAPLYDVSANIPNVTDLYNVGASQETANAAERRREEDLALMRRYYEQLAATGHGGGGASITGGGGGSGGLSPNTPPNTAFHGQPNFIGDTHGTAPPGGGFANVGIPGLPSYGGGGGGGGDWMSNDFGPAVDMSGLYAPPQPFGPMMGGGGGGLPGMGQSDNPFFIPGVSDFDGDFGLDFGSDFGLDFGDFGG